WRANDGAVPRTEFVSQARNIAQPRRVAGGAGDLSGGEEHSARGERAGRRPARDPFILAATVRAERTAGEHSELSGAPRARAPQRSRCAASTATDEPATPAARRGARGKAPRRPPDAALARVDTARLVRRSIATQVARRGTPGYLALTS